MATNNRVQQTKETEKIVIIAGMPNPESVKKTAPNTKIRESPTPEIKSLKVIETMKNPTAVKLVLIAVIKDLTIIPAIVTTDPTIVQTIVLGAAAAPEPAPI